MVDIEKLVKECGMQLYDTQVANENARVIFRVFILKDGGVSLEDCEKVSRLLSPIFDSFPPVKDDEWFLEVSSPGLERVLSKFHHYEKSINEDVKLTLMDKSKIVGKLISAKDDVIEVKSNDEVIKINLSDIKKARTYIEW